MFEIRCHGSKEVLKTCEDINSALNWAKVLKLIYHCDMVVRDQSNISTWVRLNK